MKKMFSVFLVLLSVVVFGQTQWDSKGGFPDSVAAAKFNSIHGIAVDPAGKVWVQDYYALPADTIYITLKGVPTRTAVRALHIFNPDGTEVSWSPMFYVTYPGGKDTLGGTKTNDSTWSVNTGRGLSVDYQGNILATYFGTVYKIDYRTGAGLLKIVVSPTLSTTKAASDTVGNYYVATVVPGNPLKMFSSTTGTVLGNVCDSSRGYSRGFDVAGNGLTVFWSGYSLNKVMRYTRVDDLTPFSFQDTILIGMTVECMFQDPKNRNNIWVCAGPADNQPAAPWTSHSWYKVNATTLQITDSLHYPGLGATSDAKHRGIAFSKSGDTAYVTAWPVTAALLTAPKIVRLVKHISDVRQESNIVTNFALNQNYPNPFNPSTKITFSLNKAGMTSLKIYDVLGNEVATLVNRDLNAGQYSADFDASKLSSGTYIYRLTSDGNALSRKMIVVK